MIHQLKYNIFVCLLICLTLKISIKVNTDIGNVFFNFVFQTSVSHIKRYLAILNCMPVHNIPVEGICLRS